MKNKHQDVVTVVDDVILTERLSVLKLSDGKIRIIESHIESYLADSLEDAIKIFKTHYLDQMPFNTTPDAGLPMVMTTTLSARKVVDALKHMPVSKENPGLRTTTVDFCQDVKVNLTWDTEEHSLSYWVDVRVPRILVNEQFVMSISKHFTIWEGDMVEEAFFGDEVAKSILETIVASDVRRIICQVVYYHTKLVESYRALQEYARKKENDNV